MKRSVHTIAFKDRDTIESAVVPFAGETHWHPTQGSRLNGIARIGLLPRVGLMRLSGDSLNVDINRPMGCFGLTVSYGPELGISDGARPGSFDAATAHLVEPEQEFHLQAAQGLNLLAANFFLDDLREHAAIVTAGKEEFRLPHDGRVSLSSPEGRSLARCLNFIWEELNEGRGIFNSGLVTTEIEDTLIAALILAIAAPDFDNTEKSDVRIRIAVEYLLAHLDQPLSRAGLAEACGMSIRTLSRLFAKRHNMGPMEFLRRRRLEAARAQLLLMTPADITIAAVAANFGFSQPAAFATAYKENFGESPSETLKR